MVVVWDMIRTNDRRTDEVEQRMMIVINTKRGVRRLMAAPDHMIDAQTKSDIWWSCS